MSTFHDAPLAGHRGVKPTLQLISRLFWWPTLVGDVSEFVKSCLKCQQMKTGTQRPQGLLQPLHVPDGPWHTIATDFITDLPTSQGFTVICTFMDLFTRVVHFTALPKLPTSREFAVVFITQVVRLHGLHRKVVSDRGLQFVARFWRCLCALLGIQPSLTSGYHPQSNGQAERTNQTLEAYPRCYCNQHQSDWVDYLPLAEFAINNAVHASIRVTPFFSSQGHHHRVFPDL